MIDGSVLQSTQRCFEKESRVVVKMVVNCFTFLVVNIIYFHSPFMIDVVNCTEM